MGGECRCRYAHGAGEVGNGAAGQYGTGPFRVAEILELPRHRCNARIEYAPGDLTGLAKNFCGLLGIALRFIAEPQPVAIDLNAALHDRGPGDQNIVRCRDRAVALIGAEVREFRTKRFPPHDSIAAVSWMAEIERVTHLGNEAADEILVAAKTVAGKDKNCAADTLAPAATAQNLHAADTAIGLRQQLIGDAFGYDGDIARLRGMTQPIDQLLPGASGKPCMRMAEWPG